MAGYVIHLAVGEEFLRNFPNEVKNEDEFFEGILYPDSVSDKSLTHYGPKSSKVNLKAFLDDKKLDSDFNKGYFVHLITDYLFYNQFLTVFSKNLIYYDYDMLNADLEKEFKVRIPEKAKSHVDHIKGDPKILNLEDTKKFIRKTGSYSLEEVKKEVLKGNKKWLEIRQLKKI